MVPYKSTAKEVSFEWSHHRVSSTDSKVRTTLHVSIIDSGSERDKGVTVTLIQNSYKHWSSCCVFLCAALSLRCQECGPDGEPCSDDANVTSVDCDAFADRCMTVSLTTGLNTMVMKNCAHSTVIWQEQGLGYREYNSYWSNMPFYINIYLYRYSLRADVSDFLAPRGKQTYPAVLD